MHPGGINVLMMSDFHGDSHPTDPGPLRLKEQKVYFEGCARQSDRSFLIMPEEEEQRAIHVGAAPGTAVANPVTSTLFRAKK